MEPDKAYEKYLERERREREAIQAAYARIKETLDETKDILRSMKERTSE